MPVGEVHGARGRTGDDEAGVHAKVRERVAQHHEDAGPCTVHKHINQFACPEATRDADIQSSQYRGEGASVKSDWWANASAL